MIKEDESKSETASYLMSSIASARNNAVFQALEYKVNTKKGTSKSVGKLPSEKDHTFPTIAYHLEDELRFSVEHRHATHIAAKTK